MTLVSPEKRIKFTHPRRTENSTPGPMRMLLRQLNQRSHRNAVENIHGGGKRSPSESTSWSRVQIGGRREAGILGESAGAQGSRLQTFPRGSNEPNFGYHVRACKVERLNDSFARFMYHKAYSRKKPCWRHDACIGSISGLLSVNMHSLVSPLYYTHTPQLRSTRYILSHTIRSLPDRALWEVGFFLNTVH